MSHITEIPAEHSKFYAGLSAPRSSLSTQAKHQLPVKGDAPANRALVCFLTEKDVRLLEQAVAINGGLNTPIGWSVTEKMKHVQLCNAIPADCVELDSHVVFKVDGRSQLSRVIVHWDEFFVPRLHLSLHTPWGIILLGMKAGSEAKLYWRAGRTETIKVEMVTHRSADAVLEYPSCHAR